MATNKTKIVIALYYYHPYVSGLSVMAKHVAEGLAGQGYEVTVLTSRHDKSLSQCETINSVTVIRRPVLFSIGKGVVMPTFTFDMVRYARASDYINTYLPLSESGLAALFIPKRKMVASYICDLNLGPKLSARVITFVSMLLMHLQLARSKVVTSLSTDYLQHSKMKRYLSKSVPIYPPVSIQDSVPADPKPFFARLGVKPDEVKIGFVGRIVYEKGIGYLLRAVPDLQVEFANFRIIIVGDYEKVAGGSVKDELDSYIEKYPGRILFTGYLDDADRNRFYTGLDVLVLPSIDPLEAFGIVQVEAMLCGTPVVASNLPGVREVVQRTGYGRISRIRDSADIARQIIEVVNNPDAYRPDRSKVEQVFNPQISIDNYAKIMPKKLA